MTAIQLLACAGMIVGVFLLLGMKPVEFTDSLFGFLLNPKRSLREDIRESPLKELRLILPEHTPDTLPGSYSFHWLLTHSASCFSYMHPSG